MPEVKKKKEKSHVFPVKCTNKHLEMRLCRAGAGQSFSTTDSNSSKVCRKSEAAGRRAHTQWLKHRYSSGYTYLRLVVLRSCRSEALYLVAQVILEEDSSRRSFGVFRSAI